MWVFLGTLLAGVEGRPRESQVDLYPVCEWMRATHHAPRDPCRVLERRHGLAEIVERGVVVFVERLRVTRTNREREIIDGAVKAVKRENVVPVPSAGVGSAPSSAAMAWLTPGFLSFRLSLDWSDESRGIYPWGLVVRVVRQHRVEASGASVQ